MNDDAMIAVDPHKASDTSAVLNPATKTVIEAARFANSVAGYALLSAFAGGGAADGDGRGMPWRGPIAGTASSRTTSGSPDSLRSCKQLKCVFSRSPHGSDLRKRGAKGTRTPGLLHAMNLFKHSLTRANTA